MTNRLTFGQFCSAGRKGALALCLALWTLGLGSADKPKPAFITFDAPGAGTGAFQGTIAIGINPAGAIVGQYVDASFVYHGFVRAKHDRDEEESTFTTFDAPGAGTGAFQGTFATGINPAGAIVGYYTDASGVNHGFLRAKDDRDEEESTFTTFDAPGAGTGVNQGTFPGNINPAGTIAGYYFDASKVFHGFLRTEDGTFTTFDAPGAGTAFGQGTLTAFFSGLNPAGAITGNYRDASNVNHGYVRAPDGTFTTFDAPGSQATITDSINPAGVIAGFYGDASVVFHGFVRAEDGTFATFDAPGAGTGFAQGTVPQNINPAGATTGYITDAGNVNHGFVRVKGGSVTTFDAPGAGTGAFQGTTPFSNNPAGAITGQYIDASNVSHGFLRTPRTGDSE
jgi:hypothetical protein